MKPIPIHDNMERWNHISSILEDTQFLWVVMDNKKEGDSQQEVFVLPTATKDLTT